MTRNYKKIKYDKNSNILFSLHDSRVHEIKLHNKILTLKVDKLFQYTNSLFGRNLFSRL